MSQYEERLQRDLEAIREAVRSLGEAASGALDRAVRALLTADRELAYETILRDQVINGKVRDLERRCHVFVARHLPSAGHLRYISSVLQLNIALERVGDYAVTVSRESARLSAVPSGPVQRSLELFSRQARQTLGQALEAFLSVDAELGRATKEMAAPLAGTNDKIFEDLIEEGERKIRPLRDLFGLLIVFGRLGRVVDQAQNICEEAIFAATGEVKPAKTFRVLLVDSDLGLRGIVAAAVGRKKCPTGLVYAVAARDPESPIPGHLLDFLNRRGFEARERERLPLASVAVGLREFHIVINLGLSEADLPPMPYHTVLLDWRDTACATDLRSAAETDLERIYREYADKLDELIETLQGTS